MKQWRTKEGTSIYRMLSGRSNVFLICNETLKILVDTSPARKWPLLKKKFHKLGIEKLDFLILTHTHFDHAANAGKLKRYFGCRIVVHETESKNLELGTNILPIGTNYYSKTLIRLFAPLFISKFNYEGIKADELVSEELAIEPGIFILHTPGHTPGSISLIVDNEVALVGDAMFGVFPGRIFPPFANNVADMIKSWRKLLDTSCTLFLPSHGSENSHEIVLEEFSRRSKILEVTKT